jgi:hypothetical protein
MSPRPVKQGLRGMGTLKIAGFPFFFFSDLDEGVTILGVF